MIKNLAIPFLLSLVLVFSACSKPAEETKAADETTAAEAVKDETPKGDVVKDLLPDWESEAAPKDSSYIKGMLDTALKIKFYILYYYMGHKGVYPNTLKEINYPGMTFISTNIVLPDGKTKELITGYLKDQNIYVRYEPTSFGQKENPMLSLSVSNKFSKDSANIQWINNVLSCVAYASSTIGNETCKLLKTSADTANPLRTYYHLDDTLTEEKINAATADAKAALAALEKAAAKKAPAKKGAAKQAKK